MDFSVHARTLANSSLAGGGPLASASHIQYAAQSGSSCEGGASSSTHCNGTPLTYGESNNLLMHPPKNVKNEGEGKADAYSIRQMGGGQWKGNCNFVAGNCKCLHSDLVRSNRSDLLEWICFARNRSISLDMV